MDPEASPPAPSLDTYETLALIFRTSGDRDFAAFPGLFRGGYKNRFTRRRTESRTEGTRIPRRLPPPRRLVTDGAGRQSGSGE